MQEVGSGENQHVAVFEGIDRDDGVVALFLDVDGQKDEEYDCDDEQCRVERRAELHVARAHGQADDEGCEGNHDADGAEAVKALARRSQVGDLFFLHFHAEERDERADDENGDADPRPHAPAKRVDDEASDNGADECCGGHDRTHKTQVKACFLAVVDVADDGEAHAEDGGGHHTPENVCYHNYHHVGGNGSHQKHAGAAGEADRAQNALQVRVACGDEAENGHQGNGEHARDALCQAVDVHAADVRRGGG